MKVTGFSVRESDGLPFVEIGSNFQSRRTCVRDLALNKKTHLYSDKGGKKTEESPFAAKNGCHKAIERKSTARYEIQSYKCHWSPKRPARFLKTILPESIRTLAAGKSS